MSRTLEALLQPFGIRAPALPLRELQLDSRAVAPGDAFVALRGHKLDGRRFIPAAVAAGAVAVLYEADADYQPPADIA